MKKTNRKYPAWRHYLTGLLLTLLLAAASCNKEKNNPRHRDVVTVTINGKAWEAGCKETPPFGCTIADLQYYPETGGFSLRATNEDQNIGIRIRLFGVYEPGIYKIPINQNCGGNTLGDKECESWQFFIIENDPQEIKIIDLNHEEKIIEGRFHFIGRDTICGNDPATIEDGYFKVRYRP